MSRQPFYLFLLAALLWGCGQAADKTATASTSATPNTLPNTKPIAPDTSNQYIYDFMKVVIADQKLDIGRGLSVQPEEYCDLDNDDKTFLQTMVIKKSAKQEQEDDWRNVSLTMKFPQCLTKDDVEEMLSQRRKLNNFTWNNDRLGFNRQNDTNWYCFSRPLFSRDRKKAVILIRYLCPGLCGGGHTALFTKEGKQWTSQNSAPWVH